MERTARTSDTLHRDALAVLQPGFVGTTPPDWLRHHVAAGLGSVALFSRNVTDQQQLAALTAELRAENPEILVAVDEEGGDVTRLESGNGSSWPGNLALGAIDDPGLTRDVARELGRALAECGVNYNWAPSADVNSNPGNPVIGVRSFGADPDLCARHTAAWVEGLQSVGVAACAKHFPGHGDTAVDSHLGLPVVDIDVDLLRSRDLVPFKAAIAAGAKAVMTAHIMVPALDGSRPATLSRPILDLLRRPAAEGGLGYDGLIVTDGIEMGAIAHTYGTARGTVLAVAAGVDAICVGGGLSDEETVLQLRDALVAAVRSGELPEQRLAEAAGRVRRLGAWTAARARTGGRIAPDLSIGLRAARRALRVTLPSGAVFEPITDRPYVLSLSPVANIAVGQETPWGVAGMLATRLPGTRTRSAGPREAAPELLPGLLEQIRQDAAGRRVVVVVRDAHRHAWMDAALRGLLQLRPDAAVVEMGVPQAEPIGALHIATHGAARVCGLAAVEVLTGLPGNRF
ncbi:glycoside hydrolase family 3 protein [Streptacidiphilus sp. PB12-B1b]|uniref:glycoside hydrolase family 3 protein n=1 Tax=Streptacidiphilus sp. PB12-B1b TaxID=2705012 RepID=UPI0015FB7E12|nr:glycoside hydrolase family 3 N-terminal domain-containing protein [Streptacidiphilus sp. PB12-B1b]QMU80629.1 glycoside hydrolase family 3 protein [Streptacidiphilus sp. PB12-B1b]